MSGPWKWNNKFDFGAEEARKDVYTRYETRQVKDQKHFLRRRLQNFRVFAFDWQLIRSFGEHLFNSMAILQIGFALLLTYACEKAGLVYDIQTSLFISPIVFPLAFSINTDFQRKEKVLEDLALFKSSAMMWIFCMREWREACAFDENFIKTVRNKIQGLMVHLRMYLFTEKQSDRQAIVRIIYEDLSDTNQINEKVRSSRMDTTGPLVSRTIHLLNTMCLSFERLRVLREYRSPRSIRSFTKVLIFFVLPTVLSPYYLLVAANISNPWLAYYISATVAFVFAALQGVQDKLDNPFDGMSEDDIKLDSLEEWAFHNLEAFAHRTYQVGRFQISSSNAKPSQQAPALNTNFADSGGIAPVDETDLGFAKRNRGDSGLQFPYRHENVYRHNNLTNGTPIFTPLRYERQYPTPNVNGVATNFTSGGHTDFEHPYANVLNNIMGNTTILRGGQVKNHYKSFDDLSSHAGDRSTSRLSQYSSSFTGRETPTYNHQVGVVNEALQRTPNIDHYSRESSFAHLQSLHHLAETISPVNLQSAHSPLLDFSDMDVPPSGVKSYLMNMIRQQQQEGSTTTNSAVQSRSRSGSLHSNALAHSPPPSAENNTEQHELEKPMFFIGDLPSPIGTVTQTNLRRPSPLSRCQSLPDTKECERCDNMTSTGTHRTSQNQREIANLLQKHARRSETPPPRFNITPLISNTFNSGNVATNPKSRFTVLRRNPASFSTEPLLDNSNLSRCPDSDDETDSCCNSDNDNDEIPRDPPDSLEIVCLNSRRKGGKNEHGSSSLSNRMNKDLSNSVVTNPTAAFVNGHKESPAPTGPRGSPVLNGSRESSALNSQCLRSSHEAGLQHDVPREPLDPNNRTDTSILNRNFLINNSCSSNHQNGVIDESPRQNILDRELSATFNGLRESPFDLCVGNVDADNVERLNRSRDRTPEQASLFASKVLIHDTTF